MLKKNDLCIGIMKKVLTDGSVTRPALVQCSGVRPATLFHAIDTLKELDLVCEPQRTKKYIGRKASEIIPSPEAMWCIGIDFEVRYTLGVIIDLTGSVRYHAEVPAGVRDTLAGCQAEISEVLRRLKIISGGDWSKVCGIGFADPGLVDIGKNFSIGAVNVPGWKEVETGTWLRQKSGVDAGVWPECYVKTYMEYLHHFHNASGGLFLLEMDNGIGGGFFKDGQGFTGDTNLAMEIGHIIVDPKGPICRCGNRGCLEAFVGEKGIRRRIREAISNGVQTALDKENFSWERFTECALHDKVARMIASEASESIGRALAVIVSLLNPSVIVLSGKLTELDDLLMSSIHRMLNLSCFAGAVQNLKVEFSTLKKEDTARGAARLIQERLLSCLFENDAKPRAMP